MISAFGNYGGILLLLNTMVASRPEMSDSVLPAITQDLSEVSKNHVHLIAIWDFAGVTHEFILDMWTTLWLRIKQFLSLIPNFYLLIQQYTFVLDSVLSTGWRVMKKQTLSLPS